MTGLKPNNNIPTLSFVFRHLKADLSASHIRPEKPVEEMSEEEKQFYHFKMHDYDNNNLLDGLEILQSANEHDNTFHGHSKVNPTDNGSEELGLQHLVGKQQKATTIAI